ncbi:MAG: hypothetical protein AAF399_27110, partial [Bacteroidota bacterium]
MGYPSEPNDRTGNGKGIRADSEALIEYLISQCPNYSNISSWGLNNRASYKDETKNPKEEEAPTPGGLPTRNILLIVGEPGVGKTHFLTRLEQRAKHKEKKTEHQH